MILNTADSECIVGILDVENDQFFERRCCEGNKHAESLFSVIDSVLSDAKLTYKDISDIAAVVGPGSFTGLRVSLSAAQGLRLASSVAVHGITFLELQAYLIFRSSNKNISSIVSVVETQKSNLVYRQTFSSTLMPISDISFDSKDSVFPEDNPHNFQNICSLCKDTRAIGEYLVYKLSHELPDTPLAPIYSRFYN